MSHSPHIRRYGLFATAIVLLVCAGVALFIRSEGLLIGPLGALACIVSAYLVRRSKVHAAADLTASSAREGSSGVFDRPRALMWAVGATSLMAFGISYFYLYKDALEGYHDIGPVYVFAVATVACAGVWGYLIAKL